MADQFPNTDIYEICAQCSSYRFKGTACPTCDMAADPDSTDSDDSGSDGSDEASDAE